MAGLVIGRDGWNRTTNLPLTGLLLPVELRQTMAEATWIRTCVGVTPTSFQD